MAKYNSSNRLINCYENMKHEIIIHFERGKNEPQKLRQNCWSRESERRGNKMLHIQTTRLRIYLDNGTMQFIILENVNGYENACGLYRMCIFVVCFVMCM